MSDIPPCLDEDCVDTIDATDKVGRRLDPDELRTRSASTLLFTRWTPRLGMG